MISKVSHRYTPAVDACPSHFSTGNNFLGDGSSERTQGTKTTGVVPIRCVSLTHTTGTTPFPSATPHTRGSIKQLMDYSLLQTRVNAFKAAMPHKLTTTGPSSASEQQTCKHQPAHHLRQPESRCWQAPATSGCSHSSSITGYTCTVCFYKPT